MTDHQYLELMLAFTRKLADAANDQGLESDAYKAVLTEIAITAIRFNRSRRRQAWYRLASIVLLLCVLAWGFYMMLHLLKI